MLMVPVTTNHIYIYYQWIGSREHFTGPPQKKNLGKSLVSGEDVPFHLMTDGDGSKPNK